MLRKKIKGMAKLKRLSAPSFWKIEKKASKWTVAPHPGPHKKFESIPLLILVRNVLKVVETGKEAKTIIKQGEVFVDGRARKDHAYPVGLFDVVSLPKTNQFYRVMPNNHGLNVVSIPESEGKEKVCKIEGKTILKKGQMQLNLSGGVNILIKDAKYNTGDSLLLELPSLKILKHMPLEAGSTGLVAKGALAGKVGVVKEIKAGKMKERSKILCEIEGADETVLKERFFVLGKDKPVITVGE
ncbi:30S ribosomal protein S4e [archaeon]|nr:MAG: 30S ribosomal protein S4e [archaeon]